jgi:hypothetical protein
MCVIRRMEVYLSRSADFLSLSVLSALSLGLYCNNASAGVGVGLGSATVSSGVSLKWAAEKGGALQLVVGPWTNGFSAFDGIGINLDALKEFKGIGSIGPITIDGNLGGGGGIAMGEGSLGVAGSGIAGLDFGLKTVPLELALEYRPTISIIPGVALDPVSFSGHLRWWF